MSEPLLPKYRPGDEIDTVVYIQHAPMHLREVTARFFSKGQEGGIISHMDLSGTPSISEDQSSQLQAPYKEARSGSQRRSPLMTPGASSG